MGGLSRKSAYIKTLKNNNIDPIVLDAGDALFAHSKYSVMNLPHVQYKAEAFLQGMDKIGCHALNIGGYDLAGGYEFLKGLEKKYTVPFISANLYSAETKKLAFDPYVIVKVGKMKLGIIGVTDNLSPDIKELYIKEYLIEGKAYIGKIRNDVDIVIVLVNGMINNRNTMLDEFKDADYVFLSRTVMNTRTTASQFEGLPIFYTLGLNGKQLVEVKATINDHRKPIEDVTGYENRLSSIVRQLIRLKTTEGDQTIEEKYAENPQVLTQIKNYEKQVGELENSINQVVNRSECKVVNTPTNMDYDIEMQNFIDKTLEEANNQY